MAETVPSNLFWGYKREGTGFRYFVHSAPPWLNKGTQFRYFVHSAPLRLNKGTQFRYFVYSAPLRLNKGTQFRYFVYSAPLRLNKGTQFRYFPLKEDSFQHVRLRILKTRRQPFPFCNVKNKSPELRGIACDCPHVRAYAQPMRALRKSFC
jgi:hypothetical protein